MGIIEERRNMIIAEMEAGQGSPQIFSYPVSLEPPFKPFGPRSRKTAFFRNLFTAEREAYQEKQERNKEKDSHLSFIRIRPSIEDKNSFENAEQFILSLPSSNPTTFEIIGCNKKIFFQMATEESKVGAIVSQARAQFPNAGVSIEKKDTLKETMPSQRVARAYRLRTSHFFPLCLNTDCLNPLRTLLGCLEDLEQNEMGVFQILFVPVKEDWPGNMRRASRNPYDQSQSPFVDLPHLPKSVDKKLMKPLFAVGLRLIASNESLIMAMERFFRQFENHENGIEPIVGIYPVDSILKRNTFTHGVILNSTELSYFLHLPDAELINSLPSIEQAQKSYPVPTEFASGGPVIGVNSHRGANLNVCHPKSLPNQHVYAIGKSGYGKSNLILFTAMQRIERGDGIGIIDPHGNLIKQGILPRIPRERIDDVIYFNAGDFEHPPVINPLSHNRTKLEKEHIRVDLLNFFEDLFESPLGVNVQHALNFFIITLLNFKDTTLTDLERLMIDRDWRDNILEDITDNRILTFWEQEFPLLEKRGIITAITNKLSPLILPESAITPMLCGRENKIDFLKIMDERKIFLCNLSHGSIGKRNSQLLGKLLVSRLLWFLAEINL